MLRMPWKIQIALVACGYAMVAAISAILIGWRYLQYMEHPADVDAYGGMWAGGDLMLEFFICGMLLVMTFFLMLVIYRFETAYLNYAKVLVAVSVTAPVSVGLIAIPSVSHGIPLIGFACVLRLFASPIVLAGLGMSRLFARFPRAKRMTNYALLIETLTLVSMMLMLFLPVRFHGE